MKTASINSTLISGEDLEHFKSLALAFRDRSMEPVFEGEFPDGNPALMEEVLDAAFVTGLAASQNPASEGMNYGIWGAASDPMSSDEAFGPWPSMMLLSIIAERCGGIAMSIHSQGLASNILLKTNTPVQSLRNAACFQEGHMPPDPELLLTGNCSSAVETSAIHEGDSVRLNGRKDFVYSMPGVDMFIISARIGEAAAAFAVPADTDGLTVSDAGHRTGLRACALNHVELKDAVIPESMCIDSGRGDSLIRRALCINWLGISAIAAGVARGACRAATEYTAERRQGGVQINEHPAVKSLLGSAESRTFNAELALRSVNLHNLESLESLKKCAMLKLSVLEQASQAVTDSLQCFGGYGYMEDFGMEKRLRDITVLKSASGSPLYLRLLISDSNRLRG